MKHLGLAVAVAIVTASGTVIAAEDGTLGNTSTGSADVLIVKDNVVQLTDMDNIDFGAPGFATTDLVQSDDVCVFTTTGTYNVTASSANGFTLNDALLAIPYAASWNGFDLAAIGTTGVRGVGNTSSLNCDGTTNAVIEVTISAADFNSALTGSYADTLTFVVAPI